MKLKSLKKEEVDLLKRVHNIYPVELGEIVSLGIHIELIKEALNKGSLVKWKRKNKPIDLNIQKKSVSEFVPDKTLVDDAFLNGLMDIIIKDMETPLSITEDDPRKRQEAIIRNRRAILQLFNIKVLVYPERVEIKGIVPSQVIDKASKKEFITAQAISSPCQGEGEYMI